MTDRSHSLVLAACVTCLSANPVYSQSSQLSPGKLIAQASSSEASIASGLSDTIAAFEDYVKQGNLANSQQDYEQALNYFQKALSLRPDDRQVTEALHQVKSYVYDRYMRDGYAADRQRNYQTALQSFQKALSLRPDAFYAQQAVQNVSYYIAQAETKAKGETQTVNKQKNFLFMLLGLSATATVAAGVLFSLLKTSGHEESDNSESLQEQEKLASEERIALTSSAASTELEPVQIEKQEKHSIEQNGSSSTTIISPANLSKSSSIEKTETDQSSLLVKSKNNSSLAKVDVVAELIGDLSQPEPMARRKVIWELAQRADSRAMKPLVELMIDADSQERSLILEALSQIAARTLKPLNQALMISLQDRNSQVRKNAIRDLTRVYELMSQVTEKLTQAVKDPDRDVQETAKWALGQLNQMPQIPVEILDIEPKSLDSASEVK